MTAIKGVFRAAKNWRLLEKGSCPLPQDFLKNAKYA
jgi:hypothetical protein